ncbi:MAG TPA: histidine kinase [Thermoanaerobaculia bacterium]|nr:histidine kinase [Thermoanaerobaculia bacterium]
MPRPDEPLRPLRELLGIVAALLGAWCAVAVFNSSNFFHYAVATRLPAVWTVTLYSQLITALIWAAFTPIVVAVAERLSFRRERIPRDVLVLLAVIPLLAIARALLGGAILDIGEGRWPTESMALRSITVRFHVNCFFIAVIAGITKLMDVYRDADIAERKALALQAEVADAEAGHLRAQTQPSFLFGTLKAIRDRVRTEPDTADRMLVTLGELLRRRLDQRAGEAVTLEAELVSAERYFELLGARSGAPMQVHLDIEEEILNASVPPFALQTLIETAVGDASPAGLSVHGQARASRLALEARALPADAEPAAIASAKERLQQWFGPECNADVRRDGSTVIARVGLRLSYADDAVE